MTFSLSYFKKRRKTQARPTLWGLLYLFLQNWSRWPELNRRPTPSFTPQFRKTYMGTRLYLWHILSDLATLVSRSGDCSPRSYPPEADFDRYSGFTTRFIWQWAGSLWPTMELLYQLSYNGKRGAKWELAHIFSE